MFDFFEVSSIDVSDHKFCGHEVVDIAPLSRDRSAGMSARWKFAPKEPTKVISVCEAATSINDAIRVARIYDAALDWPFFNGDIEATAIQLREEFGFEPSSIAGVHGAVDSFSVCYKVQGTRVDARITLAVDAVVRTDDQGSSDLPTVEAVNAVAIALAKTV